MFGLFKKKKPEIIQPKRNGLFSTEVDFGYDRSPVALPEFPKPKATYRTMTRETVGMDDDGDSGLYGVKPQFDTGAYGIPDAQVGWYIAQGFIGYQMCAILSQHWLIDKACSMPARDAIRNGYELTVNDGTKLTPEIQTAIRRLDKKMRLKRHMIEFVRKGRIFGIRIAMFKVDSPDPDYYLKPFNIDGVRPGSYRGIVQIDPYWIVPELTTQNLVRPDELHFYEPEFWRISGLVIHRSHLVIYTTGEVPDILKPSYFYGGVPVPQRIYERVYASERTANEAPMLAMTKRLNIMKTDITQALANPVAFSERMGWAIENRDNYGTRFIGEDDAMEQYDLTLTDLDNVIMTQYQLVAAEAEVPGTKLLGTQPKGFNSTGEFEESSYHESLESIQENDIDPLLERHYMLLVKSYIDPQFKTGLIEIEPSWNELDAMTAQEQATVNAAKAATGAALVASGAIEAQDERNRIIADPDSGYTGLSPLVPLMPDAPDPDAGGQPAGSRAAAASFAAPLPKAKATPIKGA